MALSQRRECMQIQVGIPALTSHEVLAIARHHAGIQITAEAVSAMEKSRARIEELAASPIPAYGISTGFGALATKHISPELRSQLQKSLIRSHAAGSGEAVEVEVVRAMMALRLSTMCTGRTGVRPEVAQRYADLLNAGISPLVREYGSLGCSGDLAPLSTCALALMGEGEVRDRNGHIVSADVALKAAGIPLTELVAKEGLALINGTDGMLGMLLMAIDDSSMLVKCADITAAMSIEGLLGTDRVFAEDLHALRPHPGQIASAANLRKLLSDSPLIKSHADRKSTRLNSSHTDISRMPSSA